MMRKFYLLPLAGLLAFSACRKKPVEMPDPVAPTGSNTMRMEFSNTAGNQPLTLGTAWYTTAVNDSIKINTYKYYISNVSLIAEDGAVFAEPESYHLVDQADAASRKISIASVPAGNYTRVRFMIGVDSARNTAGAQTGALDPAKAMFWTWRTGYIMAKLEGTSPSSTNGAGKLVVFHTGGYGGSNAAQRWVTLDLPTKATISSSNSPNVHIFSDALEWFKSPTLVNLSTTSDIMSPGADAMMIADNYADMFHVDHVD